MVEQRMPLDALNRNSSDCLTIVRQLLLNRYDSLKSKENYAENGILTCSVHVGIKNHCAIRRQFLHVFSHWKALQQFQSTHT